ncbi:MAG: NADH-quinone oxidoreductase subunit N [Fidelibacterota bacterium]
MEITQIVSVSDFRGILPEIVLLATSLIILTLEMVSKSLRRVMVPVGLAGYAAAFSIIFRTFSSEEVLFGGMLTVTRYTAFFDMLYFAVGSASLLIARKYLERKEGQLRGEYLALTLFATMGMMFMTRANDLVMVFLGLELLSLSLYVLIGFLRHDVASNEGGIKYLLMGAFTTGFFVFGTALVFGATGSTNYERIAAAVSDGNVLSGTLLSMGIGLLLIGFSFKVALVPFHMWSPDVYQGAPTPVTAFLGTAPKAAGFGTLIKVFLVAFPAQIGGWQDLLWILAALTMIVGNVTALLQTNVKRMLAFSSVAHAGYLLMGVVALDRGGVSGVLFYLAVYCAMNFGAFAGISLVEKGEKGVNLSDYRGLAFRHPWLAASLALFMISLAGFPPTAGFVAKYAVFTAAVNQGYLWLTVIAVLTTLVSVYYYVRLIVQMYMQEEETVLPTFVLREAAVLLAILAAIVIGLGVNPSLLLNGAVKAAEVLL